MSVPGGPPGIPADNAGLGTANPYVIWTSANSPKDYYQSTLEQLETAWATTQDRWYAVLLFRALRMRLELTSAQLSPFIANLAKLNKGKQPGIHRKFIDVVNSGRISQVGKSLTISKIESNPAHLNVDWFGEPLPHWWNDPLFNTKQAETDLTRELLWFLEDSFGLPHSGVLPANWSWPPGTQPNDWPDLVKQVPPPPVAAGYPQVKIEWHMGKNPGLVCGTTGNLFWVGTPKTARFFDF